MKWSEPEGIFVMHYIFVKLKYL